jgi:hypothetical protein
MKGKRMETPEPRFFETENKLFAHLEWEAIKHICFNGSHREIGEAYPEYEQRQFYWIDPFNEKSTDEQRQIFSRIRRGEFSTLDEFYASLKPLLKPRARGKALKDKKVRTAQAAFQKRTAWGCVY